MSISAAVLRELMTAGLEGEALLASVERIEASNAQRSPTRQNRNDRYYDSHRDELVAKASERRLKPTETTERRLNASETQETPPLKDGSTLSSNGENNQNPTPPVVPPARQPRRATQLPENFALSEADWLFALKRGMTRHDVPPEFEHFRDHHTARGTTFKDWHAAWRTWVMSPFRKPRSHGPPKLSVQDVIRNMQADDDAQEAHHANQGPPAPLLQIVRP